MSCSNILISRIRWSRSSS